MPARRFPEARKTSSGFSPGILPLPRTKTSNQTLRKKMIFQQPKMGMGMGSAMQNFISTENSV
jgi:hypothetical protein